MRVSFPRKSSLLVTHQSFIRPRNRANRDDAEKTLFHSDAWRSRHSPATASTIILIRPVFKCSCARGVEPWRRPHIPHDSLASYILHRWASQKKEKKQTNITPDAQNPQQCDGTIRSSSTRHPRRRQSQEATSCPPWGKHHSLHPATTLAANQLCTFPRASRAPRYKPRVHTESERCAPSGHLQKQRHASILWTSRRRTLSPGIPTPPSGAAERRATENLGRHEDSLLHLSTKKAPSAPTCC